MAIEISGTTVIDENRKGIFQGMNFGSYTDGTRPGSPSTGDIIYNTSVSSHQIWNGSSWISIKP